jgi:triacylglycerol esterase/lipase EstA (alpha/beta hydrolase family)
VPSHALNHRACQIFYQLKGGTVQFGEQHAAEHGHAATGKTFKPLLQRWDSDHPVHLIGNQQLHCLVALRHKCLNCIRSHLVCANLNAGHSLGGQTCRVLQHLLTIGQFDCAEYRGSSNWVRSISTINTPLCGSLLVYSLGEHNERAPEVHWGSKVRACVYAYIHQR